MAALVGEHLLGLAKQRERRGSDFEAYDARPQIRRRPIGRPVTLLVLRDLVFDLAQILAAREVAPLVLLRRRCNPRELANRRVRQLARRERFGQIGQLVECERDAHAFARGARTVPQHFFEILEQRYLAELAPDLEARCAAQQACFVAVDAAATLRERAQLAVDVLPGVALASPVHVVSFVLIDPSRSMKHSLNDRF